MKKAEYKVVSVICAIKRPSVRGCKTELRLVEMERVGYGKNDEEIYTRYWSIDEWSRDENNCWVRCYLKNITIRPNERLEFFKAGLARAEADVL